MSPPLCVIVNPRAGGGAAGRALPGVRDELRRLGLAHRVCVARDLGDARTIAREAADAGEVAVAFGGDGLIGAIADALRATPTRGGGASGLIGVLPGGRGNDFARGLGIPLSPVAACAVLAGGTPRALDLGEVGGRAFAGIASCGFDSEANRIANAARRVPGRLVYAYGAIRALARWRAATFTVTIDDGRPQTVTGYTVAVANSRSYGGGMRLAPTAALDDGRLDVVSISHLPRARFALLMPTVFSGRHVAQPIVEVARARTVAIAASRPFTVYADGDPIAQLPARISVLPAAVRVIAPAVPGAPAGRRAGSPSAGVPTADPVPAR